MIQVAVCLAAKRLWSTRRVETLSSELGSGEAWVLMWVVANERNLLNLPVSLDLFFLAPLQVLLLQDVSLGEMCHGVRPDSPHLASMTQAHCCSHFVLSTQGLALEVIRGCQSLCYFVLKFEWNFTRRLILESEEHPKVTLITVCLFFWICRCQLLLSFLCNLHHLNKGCK